MNTTTTKDLTYNGWTNWETWNANLWLNNESHTLQRAFKCDSPEELETLFELLMCEDKNFCTEYDEFTEEINWKEIFDAMNE